MAANIMFDHLGRKRKDRVFRERFEINTMTDEEIRKRYRFGKESIEKIIQLVEHRINPTTKRSHALSAQLQVHMNYQHFNFEIIVPFRKHYCFLSYAQEVLCLLK